MILDKASRWLALVLLTTSVTLAGCGSDSGQASTDVPAQEEPEESVTEIAPRETAGPTTDLPPNELGQILVLEYHRLGTPENEWRRSPENFRRDLQLLYEAGYRPITVRQLVRGEIDVPRGTTPVVFTIDDSSQGQFYLLEDGSIDSSTMVGMWSEFQKENPEWDGGATWCVLPAADYPSNFFGEAPTREVPRDVREARIRQKVTYLVDNGHEICNHTLYHARLDRAVSDAQVQEWIGRGRDSVQVYLPTDYEMVTLALPLGMWPKTRSLAWEGVHAGRPYRHEAVLEVTGGPNKSPFDREFDPLSVTRTIVTPNALERNLRRYDENPRTRYVSDGLPGVITIPAGAEDRIDRELWSGREVRVAEPVTADGEE